MSTHETTRRPAKRKRRPNYRPVIFLALVCAAIFAAGYCVGVRAADKAAPTLQEPVQESTSTPEPTHEPSEVPSTEEVLWRDDIVTDGNLLDYDLQVTMQACCEEYGVPYALALAVADVESRFDPDATSNTNDYGLMQINKVIEGNMSDAVGYRKLAINGRYIRGFGVPKYASKVTSAPSGGGEAPTPGKDEKPTPGLSVGSVVTFTGTKHYVSSNATNGATCKPGKAKVTAVAKNTKHPYHLIKVAGGGSTVYGWVDASDIQVDGAITVGAKVKVNKGAKTYTGGSLASFVYNNTYTVMQMDGDRAVIGQNGVVTAAINKKDLTLVG